MKPRVTPGKMCMDDRIFKNLPPLKFFLKVLKIREILFVFVVQCTQRELVSISNPSFSHNEILFQELLVLYISEFKP